MDYAASTPVDEEVVNEMIPYYTKEFGNPSSTHGYGRDASDAIENARMQVADIINAESEEIIFTSGGTESDNFAIKGIAFQNIDKINTPRPYYYFLHRTCCCFKHM